MICGTGICGCGCEEFVELSPKKSLRVIEQPEVCGDGSCGCGCGNYALDKEKQPTQHD